MGCALLALSGLGAALFIGMLLTGLRWAVDDRETAQVRVSTFVLLAAAAAAFFVMLASWRRYSGYMDLPASAKDDYTDQAGKLIFLMIFVGASLKTAVTGWEGLCCEKFVVPLGAILAIPLFWDWWGTTAEPEQQQLLILSLAFPLIWLLRNSRALYIENTAGRSHAERTAAIKEWLRNN